MCLPVIGAVISGIGSVVGMVQQANSYKAQAAMHERQANLERTRGSYASARASERGGQILGRQVASYAASGINPGTGSPADVIKKTGQDIGLDVAAIRYGARVAAENETTLATINRYNARTTMAAAPFAFLSPVISGIGQTIQQGGTFLHGAFA